RDRCGGGSVCGIHEERSLVAAVHALGLSVSRRTLPRTGTAEKRMSKVHPRRRGSDRRRNDQSILARACASSRALARLASTESTQSELHVKRERWVARKGRLSRRTASCAHCA